MQDIPTAKDKLLFTPGPLTTSLSVKQAMLHDAGSWHFEFNRTVAEIRNRLLSLAGLSRDSGWESVLMQGSGSFGVETILATTIPPNGKLLALSNGAYGDRIIQMAKQAKIDHCVLRKPEDTVPTPDEVETILQRDSAITDVVFVHCETTTGILNPLDEIGRVVKRHGKTFIVDAMSSFGAIPIDFKNAGIDYLVSSANKCIEGVPGFSFVLCRRDPLLACESHARSLCLDLVGQLKGFDKNGQFRYTPPTHALLAFDQALHELEAEGGIEARGRRYAANHRTLLQGMENLGIRRFLPESVQSYIITAFHFPDDISFAFEGLYRGLSDRGFIIYPGKLTEVDTFRIGTIGRLFETDIHQLVNATREVLEEMRVNH